MKAWRLHEPGGADALILEDVPTPMPAKGQVLIRIGAFGLNRSEWFSRNGDSPSVQLPRVLGIECVGTIVSAPGGEFEPGQKVAAMMGGMGREFDGSYAEYTCVPSELVFPIETQLPWSVLGSLPEMLQTVHGSLHTGLGIQSGETLLIRGGTSSIGLTSLALAKAAGLKVLSTSRTDSKASMLIDAGADEVVIDDGSISHRVRELVPEGVDRVLELIGTKTLLNSLKCAKQGGVVCMTGILGGEWELLSFRPMEQIPTGVRLTSYAGEAGNISREELQSYVGMVQNSQLNLRNGPVWKFGQLREAHQVMDANTANGKMVVVVE